MNFFIYIGILFSFFCIFIMSGISWAESIEDKIDAQLDEILAWQIDIEIDARLDEVLAWQNEID